MYLLCEIKVHNCYQMYKTADDKVQMKEYKLVPKVKGTKAVPLRVLPQ